MAPTSYPCKFPNLHLLSDFDEILYETSLFEFLLKIRTKLKIFNFFFKLEKKCTLKCKNLNVATYQVSDIDEILYETSLFLCWLTVKTKLKKKLYEKLPLPLLKISIFYPILIQVRMKHLYLTPSSQSHHSQQLYHSCYSNEKYQLYAYFSTLFIDLKKCRPNIKGSDNFSFKKKCGG